MARNEDDFGARFTDLLGLYAAAFEAIFFHFAAHGHGPATAATAIVVIPLMFHGAEVFRKIGRQLPVLLRQSTAADDIAGILYGGGFFYLVSQLDAAIPNVVVKQFYRMDDFLFGGKTQPGGRFVPKRSVGVASFSDGDLLHPQFFSPFESIFNDQF